MRVRPFFFDGYPGGNSDFESRLAAAPQTTRDDFEAMLATVVRAVQGDASAPPFVAMTVIGHSDRQDRQGMTHAQAQASEAEAGKGRAVDAWRWMLARLTELLGAPDDSWADDSPKVTWALVYAGSGMLAEPNPVTEEDRLKNRRVVILFSDFEPQV